ncbi:hypothetical protein HPB50_016496 [Hyalomma asiaticum]|uniref:Uncharacterized protein n=1 Tax=Hyalomma asiaticum TaxID=266040 RepID=A0ACB7SWU4_HYAAI|nr:hypothetical protein HPB50_016496 [Hyalomma asiaticum]
MLRARLSSLPEQLASEALDSFPADCRVPFITNQEFVPRLSAPTQSAARPPWLPPVQRPHLIIVRPAGASNFMRARHKRTLQRCALFYVSASFALRLCMQLQKDSHSAIVYAVGITPEMRLEAS